MPWTAPTHTPGTNDYVFQVNTSQLGLRPHYLSVTGTDDFGNQSNYMTDFSVGSETGTSLADAAASPQGASPAARKRGGAREACRVRDYDSLADTAPSTQVMIVKGPMSYEGISEAGS